jgi:hypothetical protein
VGHVGPLAKKHDSGMRSFDIRCTSYNPEASGKNKLTEFVLRCFFDTGRCWDMYEPPRSGTLVHIVGQLIGSYKEGNDEKPAVLITDFKALPSSGSSANPPEITTPTKRRYGPKSSRILPSPVTPDRSEPTTVAISPIRLNLRDTDSLHKTVSVSREDIEALTEPAESQLQRPKRMKRGEKDRR